MRPEQITGRPMVISPCESPTSASTSAIGYTKTSTKTPKSRTVHQKRLHPGRLTWNLKTFENHWVVEEHRLPVWVHAKPGSMSVSSQAFRRRVRHSFSLPPTAAVRTVFFLRRERYRQGVRKAIIYYYLEDRNGFALSPNRWDVVLW